MEPYNNWVPGIVVPNFSRDPIGDEGELTAGPDDMNPAEDPEAREMIEALERKQNEYAYRDDKVARTVPNPNNPDLPPATIKQDPTSGNDPFVFDDIGGEVDSLGLPGVEGGVDFPDFEGEMFKF